jgi:PRTRC genetic system protein E
MFSELMPLLAERTVLITVARESGTTIRATVVPKRTSESENAALSTPLSFVGTPEELAETGPQKKDGLREAGRVRGHPPFSSQKAAERYLLTP